MSGRDEQINAALENARQRLLSELRSDGRWQGELSSSALATAVASFALKLAGRNELAERGLSWLKKNRNSDGGWGDSPESPSNYTATLLCQCVLDEETGPPRETVRSILEFYGNDRTFSAPILTLCMLSGKLGDDWSMVPQLPFELAIIPHRFYRFLRLPVVSYALPALIAIGLVRHKNKPAPVSFLRTSLIFRILNILEEIQPESGGFLEAAPLTGFVGMSLVGAGFSDHPVTQSCFRFLENTVREDGSWPIDINLSTWVTSLATGALGPGFSKEQSNSIRDYLLNTQWKEEHPFTHAAPGGWGWTYEKGGVPDADDTAAALIALHVLRQSEKSASHVEHPEASGQSAQCGIKWLLDLQNSDGGIPTFCKGWGKLPFDRSCPDLTAHAIRAFAAWRDEVSPEQWRQMKHAIHLGLAYLKKEQRADGSWIPLWFGNQADKNQENPVYGTVRVLEALEVLDDSEFPNVDPLKTRGFQWLQKEQNPDGSWGNSIEETALAVGMTGKGVSKLLEMTENGTVFSASPIGLYFASLWYSEKLYPLIFTVEALKRAAELDGE